MTTSNTVQISAKAQALLNALDERTATKYHCNFVNGRGFNSPVDGDENDQYGGWLPEEWAIMTGLSAIASYHFYMTHGTPGGAEMQLKDIEAAADTLCWWLRLEVA